MANKVLFCATVDYHFHLFHLPYLKWFKEQGWEVHIAANGERSLPYIDHKWTIPIQRSPFKKENIQAYRELEQLIEKQQYDIIHCHTPMGGVLARLAARKARKNGTKVIYTAHGFHFCKGSPLMNWLLYYPVERELARYTDWLVTINREDYNLADKHFKAGSVKLINGVGVNTAVYKPLKKEEKEKERESFGYEPNDFLLFYAAEFNQNKNQSLLLEAVALIKSEVPNMKLLLAGKGNLLDNCRQKAKQLGIEHMVEFLGYRSDLDRLIPVCDVAVASSRREGLPVNIMEAMSCGLPVIALDNRGHRELVHNNRNGWLIEDSSPEKFARKISVLAHSGEVRKKMGSNGRNLIVDYFSIEKIVIKKSELYKACMANPERKSAEAALSGGS